jgi:hypothetical protein
VKLNGEVVADFLILVHSRWSPTGRDRIYDFLTYALLQRDRRMGTIHNPASILGR